MTRLPFMAERLAQFRDYGRGLPGYVEDALDYNQEAGRRAKEMQDQQLFQLLMQVNEARNRYAQDAQRGNIDMALGAQEQNAAAQRQAMQAQNALDLQAMQGAQQSDLANQRFAHDRRMQRTEGRQRYGLQELLGEQGISQLNEDYRNRMLMLAAQQGYKSADSELEYLRKQNDQGRTLMDQLGTLQNRLKEPGQRTLVAIESKLRAVDEQKAANKIDEREWLKARQMIFEELNGARIMQHVVPYGDKADDMKSINGLLYMRSPDGSLAPIGFDPDADPELIKKVTQIPIGRDGAMMAINPANGQAVMVQPPRPVLQGVGRGQAGTAGAQVKPAQINMKDLSTMVDNIMAEAQVNKVQMTVDDAIKIATDRLKAFQNAANEMNGAMPSATNQMPPPGSQQMPDPRAAQRPAPGAAPAPSPAEGEPQQPQSASDWIRGISQAAGQYVKSNPELAAALETIAKIKEVHDSGQPLSPEMLDAYNRAVNVLQSMKRQGESLSIQENRRPSAPNWGPAPPQRAPKYPLSSPPLGDTWQP